MMKKSISFFAVLLCMLMCMLSVSVGASDAYINTDRTLPLLIDEPELLTQSEYSELLAVLEDLSARQMCEVGAAIVNSLGGKSAQAFADDLFDYNGYGYGSSDDGMLLIIAMNEREWHISTHGYGITAMNDYAIRIASNEIVPQLSDGSYYVALLRYIELAERSLTAARSGTPLGYQNRYNGPPSNSAVIAVSLIVGFIIALVVTGGMRSQLKTVRPKNSAADYTVRDSMHVTSNRDVFLYRNVTKTAKPKPSSSGGGSSTHRSSSGRTHGGGGGKF